MDLYGVFLFCFCGRSDMCVGAAASGYMLPDTVIMCLGRGKIR